mgnify:CR=1 FL=1
MVPPIPHTDPLVWRDDAVALFVEIHDCAYTGNRARLVELAGLIPRWIRGTKETGRSGCPNVMAEAYERCVAYLAFVPQNATRVAVREDVAAEVTLRDDYEARQHFADATWDRETDWS